MSNQTFFQDWAPRLRETPFGLLSYPLGVELPAGHLPAIVVDRGLTLQAPSTGDHTAMTSLTGLLSLAANQYFIVDVQGHLSDGDFEIAVGQNKVLTRLKVSRTTIALDDLKVETQQPARQIIVIQERQIDGRVKLRFAFKLNDQRSRELSKTVTLADIGTGLRVDFTTSYRGELFMLRLRTSGEVASQLVIPAGFRGAKTVESELPARSGLYQATAPGYYSGYYFETNSIHQIDGAQSRPMNDPLLLKSNQDAHVSGQWAFVKPLKVESGYLSMGVNSTLLTSNRVGPNVIDSTLIGSDINTAAVTQSAIVHTDIHQAQLIQDSVLVNGEYPQTHSVRQSVLIGDHQVDTNELLDRSVWLGQIKTAVLPHSDRSVLIGVLPLQKLTELSESLLLGQRLLENGVKLRKSIHLGTDHGLRSRNSIGNVWIGHGLGQDSDLQHSVLIGKQIVADAADRTVGFVAIGFRSGFKAYNHAMAIGHDAQPSGEFAIQLGGPRHQVETFKGVSVRSDERDVIESRPTQLGLDFIMALQPKDVRWNYREHYLRDIALPTSPPIEPEPVLPNAGPAYQQYLEDQKQYLALKQQYDTAKLSREQDIAARRQQLKNLKRSERDNHASATFEPALLVQDIQHASLATGLEFNGIKLDGGRDGLDVASLRPDTIIPPLVRAVQELNSEARLDDLVNRVALRVLELLEKRRSNTEQ